MEFQVDPKTLGQQHASDSLPTTSSTSVESVASEVVQTEGGKAEGGKTEDEQRSLTEDAASSLDETPTDSTAVATSEDGAPAAVDAEAAEAPDALNINADVLELGIEDDDLLAEGKWREIAGFISFLSTAVAFPDFWKLVD